MMNADFLTISPAKARLDISTVCQLRCVLCPTEENAGRAFLGSGTMAHSAFDRFLECNPQIKSIELTKSGEALLNPELPDMLKSAYELGVETSLAGGVNMNDVSDDALEALVRFGTTRIKVAVDGITEETYRKYRIGGSLHKVLANIKRINAFKKMYRSVHPELILQFIVFGHNEHEIEGAFLLGRMLDMRVFIKLNRCSDRLCVRDGQRIRKLFGYADRKEFLEATGTQYCRDLCLGLWTSPQINWDGRLLGCGGNNHIALGGYVLGEEFIREINNERMQYARKMLMGSAPPRDDIPCSCCSFYNQIQEHNLWYSPKEIFSAICQSRIIRSRTSRRTSGPGVVSKTSSPSI